MTRHPSSPFLPRLTHCARIKIPLAVNLKVDPRRGRRSRIDAPRIHSSGPSRFAGWRSADRRRWSCASKRPPARLFRQSWLGSCRDHGLRSVALSSQRPLWQLGSESRDAAGPIARQHEGCRTAMCSSMDFTMASYLPALPSAAPWRKLRPMTRNSLRGFRNHGTRWRRQETSGNDHAAFAEH